MQEFSDIERFTHPRTAASSSTFSHTRYPQPSRRRKAGARGQARSGPAWGPRRVRRRRPRRPTRSAGRAPRRGAQSRHRRRDRESEPPLAFRRSTRRPNFGKSVLGSRANLPNHQNNKAVLSEKNVRTTEEKKEDAPVAPAIGSQRPGGCEVDRRDKEPERAPRRCVRAERGLEVEVRRRRGAHALRDADGLGSRALGGSANPFGRRRADFARLRPDRI